MLKLKGIAVEIVSYTQTSKIISDVNDAQSNLDIGFLVQAVAPSAYPNLMSLGSIMMDPLFIFQRPGLTIGSPTQLKNLKFGVSPAGSGSRVISDMFLAAYGITPVSSNLVVLPLFEMEKAIEDGSIDVAFFLQPATNSVVAGLGERGRATLVSTEHAEAITKKHGHLSTVVISQGAFSIEKNIPPENTKMLAVPVTVIAKSDLHPALVTAIALALKQIVAPPTLVSKPGEFPTMDIEHSFEDSARAAEIYKLGTGNEPLLYKHLTYKFAGMLDSLTLILSILISIYVISLHLIEPIKIWMEKKPHRQLRKLASNRNKQAFD